MLFEYLEKISEYILFASCLFILAGSIFLTWKTRFAQVRFIPVLFRMLRTSLQLGKLKEEAGTISPHKALFTAMSTTLGISSIVGPVIAIHLGGPGALFGFLLTAFFGSAATYTEVSLSVQYRKKLENGAVMGGPMQYLQAIFSPSAAKWYAVSCLILMMAWSGAQANQLVAIFDSPLLGAYRVPTYISGAIISALVLVTLMGGIKRIGSFSAKLVPLMFLIYVGATLWIIFCNVDQLGNVFKTMFASALSPFALANGTLVGGIVSALRWGIFKGIQSSEAGIGTQAIPHSMAETANPEAQGALSMLSTYTAGIVAFLSGCVALLTGTWQDSSLPLGMSMVAASFHQYFSVFGLSIVAISTLLFGFGTILGNSYNGSQCFSYLMQNKKMRVYLISTALMIFIGAISEVKFIWSIVDLILTCMAIPHIAALMVHAQKQKEYFRFSPDRLQNSEK